MIQKSFQGPLEGLHTSFQGIGKRCQKNLDLSLHLEKMRFKNVRTIVFMTPKTKFQSKLPVRFPEELAAHL